MVNRGTEIILALACALLSLQLSGSLTVREPSLDANERPHHKGDIFMTDPSDAVASMCQRYQEAVNANDSSAYRALFAKDAIRIPPGSEPEYGPDDIAASEQSDYDLARWSIQSRPIDTLRISDEWVYGIAHVDVTTIAHADGARKSFQATKTWLLQRDVSGEWSIKRQMWNLK